MLLKLATQHWPIIYLRYFRRHSPPLTHAVVIKDWRTDGNKIILKVRNSSKGQIADDGQVQSGEHEVEYKVTRYLNKWNLAADQCIYVKFV